VAFCGDHAILTHAHNECGSGLVLCQAGFHCQPNQDFDVPDVAAFLEISTHDPLLDGRLAARTSRMCYQQV
jgi:Cft2 family RNA processing exonuclease